MKNLAQATIPQPLIPVIEAYLGLVTDPNYSNEELNINPNKLPIAIGAASVGPGTFSINHNTDVFVADTESNARCIRDFINLDFPISFSDIPGATKHFRIASLHFDELLFESLYDPNMLGFPQCFYDLIGGLLDHKVYSVESSLAIFGSLLHQITVPYWDEWMEDEDLKETETYRILGLHFEIISAVQNDLEYSKKQYEPSSFD